MRLKMKKKEILTYERGHRLADKITYLIGSKVRYKGKLLTIIQAHITQSGIPMVLASDDYTSHWFTPDT
jgi:hypothetical protein